MALTALGALAIGAGAKALTGIGQMLFAPKSKPEPKYEIPKEVFEATQRAKEMEQTGMPEASRMMALQGAQQAALFGMRGAQDRRAGLMSIGNIQAQQDRSALSIASQDAAMRQQNMLRTQQALMTQAQFKDKAFANQWQSWMNKEQQRRALLGAGIQNIAGAADTFLAGYLQNQYTQALMGGETPSFGGTELTPVTSGFTGAGNPLSGMNAVIGRGARLSMPGRQISSQSNIPQPSYGLTSDQMLSRSIFNSLITR